MAWNFIASGANFGVNPSALEGRVWQLSASSSHNTWPIKSVFGTAPQVTNWLFTWLRFWPDLAHFSWISAIF
jgi:hypothetical protein